MTTALGLDALPNEILSLIITRHIPLRWRFMARRVCARWRDLLDAAARSVPPAASRDSTWERRRGMRARDTAIDYSALRPEWEKGVVVTASALTKCIIAPAARCAKRPDLLVEHCVEEWGVPIHCVPALFVASQGVALVRYATVIAKALTFDSRSDTDIVRAGDLSWAFDKVKTTRLAFAAGLVDVAVATGDLDTVRWVVSSFDPPFDWSKIDTLHWIGAALYGERLDAVAFALASWAAATNQSGSRHDDVLSTLWLALGQLPAERIMRLIGLACASKRRGRPRRRRAACNRHAVGARDSCGVDHQHDPNADATIDTVAGIVGQTAVVRLGKCLVDSWQDRGALVCASSAARAGNVGVVAFACKSVKPEDARDVAAVACRCGHVDAVRWCVLAGRLITARDAALYASEPRRWGEHCARSKNDTAALAWLFDPHGGACVPSRDDIALMIRTSLADRYVARAVWIARRHSDKVSPSDVARIVGSACHCGVESMYATVDDLETVVHMMDAVAAVSADACAQCDMWADLWSARGMCEGDTLCLLRYAWARTNGIDAHVAASLLGKCFGRPPAPSRAWVRWCRVRSVGDGSEYGGADKESAIRAWFAARGIAPRL
ncbi:hypothetical protein pkur_cds_812 [Pandoravirus kuranda]|uniref:F-box domain containing protein n=1 Tax=Pandoravirus kuranda TaxID=3019033 RepID=A0AA95J835_9VIRU|nr:hypothetical protein pkur_cds_812 [Pandoravirus kuranda]